jgi:hypothetical protein
MCYSSRDFSKGRPIGLPSVYECVSELVQVCGAGRSQFRPGAHKDRPTIAIPGASLPKAAAAANVLDYRLPSGP